MDKWAIAFCGGGGKGAFQIGVWKALKEGGFLDKIGAVSGSSIGALNAALFAIGDYQKAEKVWYSIGQSTVLSPNEKQTYGLFSRDGLMELLNKVELEKVEASPLEVFVNVFNTDEEKTESFSLKGISSYEKKELLLASSALPILYDPVEKNGKKYMDGGVNKYGNVPITPLIHAGYKKILIVSLDSGFNIHNIYDSAIPHVAARIDAEKRYPDCRFLCIKPLDHLGNFLTGTLDFTQTGIRSRMIEGYKVTKKLLREEEVYIMKNDYAKINVQIQLKMKRLLKTQEELENFIKVTNFSEPNLAMITMGGTIWYEDIVELFGWKLQQYKLIGFRSHYRILDHNNIRRAWVFDPEDILQALDDYEAAMEFEGQLDKNNEEVTEEAN